MYAYSSEFYTLATSFISEHCITAYIGMYFTLVTYENHFDQPTYVCINITVAL